MDKSASDETEVHVRALFLSRAHIFARLIGATFIRVGHATGGLLY